MRSLHKGLEIEVIPRVVKPLSINELLGAKQNNVEIPVEIKAKLDEFYSAFKSNKKEIKDKLEGEIASMFPEDIRDDIIDRLWDFGRLENVGDRSYNAIWKYFVKNGMQVGSGSGSGTGTCGDSGAGYGDGSGAGPIPKDVENIRKAAEFAERIEEAYKKLEAFDSDPWNMKDEEEVNRLYQERLEIIRNIGAENLKSYDAERYKGVEYINGEYAGKLDSFKELKDEAIYKQLDEDYGYDNEIISESKELEVLLAKRRELMQQIYFDAEQEYNDQIEINQAIERRIVLMKELEPLVANGSLTRDDLEALVYERGDLDERRKALFGVQTDLFNEEQNPLLFIAFRLFFFACKNHLNIRLLLTLGW